MPKYVSRRSFLASSSAAAAASVFTPGGAFLTLPAWGFDTKPLPDWKNKGVLDLTRSPYAKLKMVPVSAVKVTGFWASRRRTNVESSIPSMHRQLVEHGRMTNFERMRGRSDAPQRGPLYSDSDVYKWLEAVGFVLETEGRSPLRQTSDQMIQEIVAVQEPGGYLNTYFNGEKKPERMLQHTQEVGHELYCMGHLLQAGIAYYRATGDRTMLDAGIRFVDDFLLPHYGPGPGRTPIVAGHPEIEMALTELYRTTGNQRYLDLAGYILNGDSRWMVKPQMVTYMFCGAPFTHRTKLEGHAVRAMYACCGAADYYLETGDAAYWKTLNTLWQDLSEHQMYVTGGVGARADGEAFGKAYELPNERAYGESCAAIGNMMWNARMLAASGEARFTDVVERALYNGINSGMSLDGTMYCYRNPLAFEPATGDVIRNPWYDTTCCPPNLERTFASLPGYFYSTSKDGVYVHLYDASEMTWQLADGSGLRLEQRTNYPWDGEVELHVTPAEPKEFTLYVRIPGWSRTSTIHVNGKAVDGAKPGEYMAIRRRWTQGDKVALGFDMTPRMIEANPAVSEDVGKVVLQRGPVVYCMERLDQKVPTHELNMADLRAHTRGETKVRYEAELLGGITVLEHPGSLAATDAMSLYHAAGDDAASTKPVSLTLIPYYAWSNRAPSSMQVWIPAAQGSLA